MTIRIGSTTRRRFLATSAAATAFTTIGGIARPFVSRANDRPVITHGLQSGDISTRFRRCMGSRRSAFAHVGRNRHDRQL